MSKQISRHDFAEYHFTEKQAALIERLFTELDAANERAERRATLLDTAHNETAAANRRVMELETGRQSRKRQHKNAQSGMDSMRDELMKTNDALQIQLTALREHIENAPHGDDCHEQSPAWRARMGHADGIHIPCDCWKSKAKGEG